MGTFGASFVHAGADGDARFAAICRALREQNETWLAASPDHNAIEYTVRRSDGAPWISVQNGMSHDLLQKLSAELGAVAINISGCDEIMLSFSYRRFEGGRVVRALDYVDDRPGGEGSWTLVDGTQEAWEEVLFSNKLIGLYFRYAPKEADRAVLRKVIERGASIPWACDSETLTAIVDWLQLPWRPFDDTFPPASHTEVVAGSPPDRWKKFLRSLHRPWWKFW